MSRFEESEHVQSSTKRNSVPNVEERYIIYIDREIMLFIGKPMGRWIMISNDI